MLFNSMQYVLFFPAVTLIYFVLPKKIRYLWLLAASYYFYMCWNTQYILLIFSSTLITYLGGFWIEKTKKANFRKWILAGSLFFNFGMLFFFKYANFSMNAVQRLAGLFHFQIALPRFDYLLPVGISFFTFQAVGYAIDVYRGTIPAEKNFFRYALFVSFFPQLVAGPIERSGKLLSQIKNPKPFSLDQLRNGIILMIWGFFLKIVLADRIAVFVDHVYANIGAFPGWYLIIATILFGIQIYCDFGGYTTIAMGSAKILGFDLTDNFDAPYLSISISQFWRRWHISLTSWFRDYLYFPLGGSRKGKWRKHLNRMIVFLVSGLWHGANYTFVIWGALNGMYQVLGEVLKPLRDRAVSALKLNRESFGHKLLCGIITFMLVDFSWIFFRAQSISEAGTIIFSMFHDYNPWILIDGSLFNCGLDTGNFILMLISIVILFCFDVLKRKKINLTDQICRQDYWFRWMLIALAVCAVLLFGIWGPSYDAASFIYFQF